MIRVLHVGLGPIGAAVARQVAARKGLRIVGAIDIDPLKVGQDVGAVIGLDRKLRAMPAPPPMPTDPVEALHRREAEALVESFLATLDEDSRMVFVLVEIEGMTAPEVEVALGVKLNTVYSRLRRARAAFARVIETEGER